MPVSVFNLRHTFESGQPLTFYGDYSHMSGTLTYPYDSMIINLMHSGGTDKGVIRVVSRNPSRAASEVRRRFRLDDNMPLIYKKISTDDFMKKAVSNYRGMRLTINDPWETTVVFILSQFNNVKRIRLITKNIIERFGSNITDDYGKVIAKGFPQSRDLLKATEKDYRELGAGFRAKYLKEAASYCTYNIDLHKLPAAKYDKLKENLMTINGVGDKVADCIALMGYGNLEAFPIDVWVERMLERVYFKGKKKRMKDLQKFARERFGKYSGYAQQYLFWQGRSSKGVIE